MPLRVRDTRAPAPPRPPEAEPPERPRAGAQAEEPDTLTPEPDTLSEDAPLPLLAVGEEVAGRYRVEARLARGARGEVYEALDLALQEPVALKVIRPCGEVDAEGAAERFRREAQPARKVAHPNVCRTFDVGVHRPRGGGAARPFLTMELLRGETLKDLLEREGRVSAADLLPLVRQMVAGLSAAHAAGVLHRGLKASNVLLVLDPEGQDALRVVLTGFGLARSPAGPEASSGPRTGELPGTPATDVDALGLVLLELLTGTRPSRAASPLATAMRRLRQALPSRRRHVPELDRRWEQALRRCLERAPARRFARAHELLRALEAPAPHPHWLPLTALCALVLLALAVALPGRPAPEAPRAAPVRAAPAVHSAAVLGFGNLSGGADAAWLSLALRELLAMELAAGAGLRTVSGERVEGLVQELGLPDSGALSTAQLRQLRERAGVDWVVSGSHVSLASAQGGALRLDVRVQDAATGQTVASLSEVGEGERLLELAARAGARLRGALGTPGAARAGEAAP